MTAEDQEPELSAMAAVLAALSPLDEDARARVLSWIAGKLDIRNGRRSDRQTNRPHDDDVPEDQNTNFPGEYSSFAELCSAASPTTDSQKALVAGYWFQEVEGLDTFGSQECNDQLKHFGTPIGNVTRAFDGLKNTKPQLVMQVQKSGKSKQARKKFKLTHAGIEEVKRMISA